MLLYKWLIFAPVFAKCLFRLPLRHLIYMARQFRYENPHAVGGRTHINSFFPPYPSKAFDRFLEAVFNRWRVPFSAYFAVTDQCPYACPHCSYGKHIRGHLDTAKALEVIRQLKSIGTITIGFSGGEPLLRNDIVQLVNAAGGDTATVMFTTGYNLTTELARDLYNARLDCITIGIESDDSAKHDAIRGVKGSFDTALSAIDVSLAAGLYTAISTIAGRDKLNDGTLERLAQLAADWGVHEFRILEPIPTGRYSGENLEILTPDESRRLARFHKDWNKKGNGPAIACFAHLESDAMFGCGAGFHHLFIDALGNVCPCDLTPLKMGNCLDEPLCRIWTRMRQWFDLPRCGCLMKNLCRMGAFENIDEFPLGRNRTEELCGQFEATRELPRIFANLFKDHKPIDPPANRP